MDADKAREVASLFGNLPAFPVALPADDLALLARLHGANWPDTMEVSWRDRAAARRLEKRGLIKVSRQKMDTIAIDPDWFAGLLPTAAIREIAQEKTSG